MSPPGKNSNLDSWDALRRDRDRWAQLAMDQAEYIRQLEQEITNYQKQLNMQQDQTKGAFINYGTFIAEQHNEIHDNDHCPIYVCPPNNTSSTDPDNRQDKDSRIKKLFLTPDGIEDIPRTNEERNRFLNYLTEHHWSKRQLDCSRDNPLIKAIVCFCIKWQQLKYIKKKTSPTAIVRFLTDTCGIECASDEIAVSAHIGRLLKVDYDKDVFFDVCDYFN